MTPLIPKIMGIINVTPDSFYQHSRVSSIKETTQRAQEMIEQGVDIIDVGGESTRPGAKPMSTSIQLERVIPTIQAIRSISDIPISIDTSDAKVMQASLDVGANMINDVQGLSQPGALACAATNQVKVCLMHMQGLPEDMQHLPTYPNNDIITAIQTWFTSRIQLCLDAGMARHNIILDPGFGFGKTAEHNWTLLNQLEEFKKIGLPLLVGLSRKSMFHSLPNAKETDQRLIPSTTAAAIAVIRGATIIRTHDVQETKQAVMTAWLIMQEGKYVNT